jgi:hypothetical protein
MTFQVFSFQLFTVALSRLRVRMITLGTSEQEVPGSVSREYPVEPRDTPPRVHRKRALRGPRSMGRMPPTLGLMPPKDGFSRLWLYDRGQTICSPERRKSLR